MLFKHIIIIACGGALGGIARFWLSTAVNRWHGGTFPWGTLTVNTSGSLLIGVLAAYLPATPTDPVWAFLVVGLLGSYTTVSSFSLETLTLVRNGQYGQAGTNILLSLILCLLAAAGGYGLASSIATL